MSGLCDYHEGSLQGQLNRPDTTMAVSSSSKLCRCRCRRRDNRMSLTKLID